MLTTITTTMDLLYRKYLIPMILLNSKGEIQNPNTSWQTKESLRKQLHKIDSSKINLYHMGTYMFGLLPFVHHEEQYFMIVGPCGVIGTAEESCFFLGHEYHYQVHYSKEDKYSFEEFITLLHVILTHEVLDKDKIHWSYQNQDTSQKVKTEFNLEQNLYDRRANEASFDSYQFELRYIEYIKRNEPEKVAWVFKKMTETYQVDLSPFQLEGLKLKFSAFVAVVTRMTIDEGVPINQAFGLSDSLIQGLVNIHSVDECLRYIKEATYRFMDLLKSYPLAEKSLLVKTIVNYIDDHLYEKVTMEQLTSITNKHRTHIANQFKKEMNQTIHTYVQERKIEEAKHLLLFTDNSFEEIASLLAFSSQSHFIQVFKKVTGITPKTYKTTHYAYALA